MAVLTLSASGKLHKPPQIPLLGRFSSKYEPLGCLIINRVVDFSGLAFLGFEFGNCVGSPVFSPRHSLFNGQLMQFGLERVQTVAPKSIMACVYWRELCLGCNSSAYAHSFFSIVVLPEELQPKHSSRQYT